MKQNLNFSDKGNDAPLLLCPCPAPKRLLTSTNWHTRNDSSSINAVLHPETNVSPRLKYNQKTKDNVISKQMLSRNNCYCTYDSKNLPRPTLFKRPNTCVSFEPLSGNNILESADNLKRKSLTKCVCKSDDDSDVGSDLDHGRSIRGSKVKHARSLPVQVLDLKHTQHRKNYEQYRRTQDEKHREKLRRFEEDCKYDQLGKKLAAGDSKHLDVILDPRNFGTTVTSLSNYGHTESSFPEQNNAVTSDDLQSEDFPVYDEWSVPNFRKEHYFETHHIGKLHEITGDLAKDEHTCIHQFRLNKKHLPEPVTRDTFGRSVCKLCGKPMEGSTLNLASTLFSGDGFSKSKVKNFADSSKSGFSPTTINLGRGKSKIELLLTDSDITKFGSYICKSKNPVYCNSLALRHQRQRLI